MAGVKKIFYYKKSFPSTLTNELPYFVCSRSQMNSTFPLKTFQHYPVLRNVTDEHLLMINHPQED
jgi:hypothetical protein